MVIALVALLILGGGLGGGGVELFEKDTRKLVSEVVDPIRASAIVDEMKRAQKDLDGHIKEVGDLVKTWRKLDRDHSSGRAELEPLIDEAMAHRTAAQKAFTDSLFKMRVQTTEKEWNQIFPSHKEDG